MTLKAGGCQIQVNLLLKWTFWIIKYWHLKADDCSEEVTANRFVCILLLLYKCALEYNTDYCLKIYVNHSLPGAVNDTWKKISHCHLWLSGICTNFHVAFDCYISCSVHIILCPRRCVTCVVSVRRQATKQPNLSFLSISRSVPYFLLFVSRRALCYVQFI